MADHPQTDTDAPVYRGGTEGTTQEVGHFSFSISEAAKVYSLTLKLSKND